MINIDQSRYLSALSYDHYYRLLISLFGGITRRLMSPESKVAYLKACSDFFSRDLIAQLAKLCMKFAYVINL